MEVLLLVLYFTVVFVYAVRTDSAPRQLLQLEVDGELLEGWRVLRLGAFLNRRIGLLNHVAMPERTGLLLARGRTIHTKGMVFAIDVAFLAKDGAILAMKKSLAPGERRVKGPRGTKMVLEVAPGALPDGAKRLTFRACSAAP